MEVIIDHERTFRFPEEPGDVLSAVAMISESLRKKGRAILSLRVNDVAVSPEDLIPTLENRPLSAVNLLTIVSEDITTLVTNSLAELERVLPELPEVCHRLAEVFQGECPESGYEPFQQLAMIWKTIKEREIQVLNALDLGVDQLVVDGVPMAQMHEELNRYVDEAAEALKAEDCVLLGDLLEYELAPRAEAEAAIVALLRSRVGG
jgi:hypothetical protein